MGTFAGVESVVHDGRDDHATEPRVRIDDQEAAVAAPYGPHDLPTGIDPRDRVHHALWAHHVESSEDGGSRTFGDGIAAALGGTSIDGEVAVDQPTYGGPVMGGIDRTDSKKEKPGSLGYAIDKAEEFVKSGTPARELLEAGHIAAGGFFNGGDFLLHHGGQVVLDIGGFVPGVNVLTEGLQAGYHGLHAAYDAHEGHSREAKEEAFEAAEHGGFALLNLLSGEGGAATEAVGHAAEEGGVVHRIAESGEAMRSRMQASLGVEKLQITSQAIHKAHLGVDMTETGWDTTSSVVQGMSGKHVPFLGGLVPWMLDGATDEEE